jgi:hypothetical protein
MLNIEVALKILEAYGLATKKITVVNIFTSAA